MAIIKVGVNHQIELQKINSKKIRAYFFKTQEKKNIKQYLLIPSPEKLLISCQTENKDI